MIKFFRLFAICTFLLLTASSYSQTENSAGFNSLLIQADSLSNEGIYDEALILYEEALKIEPTSLNLDHKRRFYNSLIKKYAYLGLFEDAEKRNRELLLNFEGEETNNQIHLEIEASCLSAVIESFKKNYNKALDFVLLSEALNRSSNAFPYLLCPYRVYMLSGHKNEAREQLKILLAAEPQNPYYLLYSAFLEKEAGNNEKFSQLMETLTQLKKVVDAGQTSWSKGKIEYLLAIYSILQDKDSEAVAHLRKAYEAGNKQYYWWKNFNPFFRQLETKEAYQKLIGEMKSDIDQMRENYLQSKSS